VSDALLAADQHRRAVAAGAESERRADHALLLALGEHHALGVGAHLVEDALQARRGRIEPAAQARAVGVHVLDRPARDAALHRGFGDRRGHRPDEAWIERRRHDVVGPVLQAVAGIGGGHLVGHVLARQHGQGLGRGDLHGVVDGGGAHVESAAEDIGEAQHVVDLVRVVRAARADDGVGAHLLHLLGRDLGIGIGHGGDHRLRRHRLHHGGRHRALGREAEEHVGALERLRERALLGLDRVGRLPLVHALGAALVDHALGVAEDRVVVRQPHGFQQLHAGDRGGARAVHHQLGRFEIAAGQMQRVDERRGRDDGSAVLVVVEDWNVEQLAQALLDDEALRRLDVLEVDAAEGRVQVAHAVDELVDVLGVDLEIETVDAGEALKQHRLAFHDRLGRERAQISEPQDRGAIGDHRHQIALGGEVIGERRVLLDVQAGKRHPRRIGEREIELGRERLGGGDRELPGLALGVEAKRFLLAHSNGGDFLGGHGRFPLYCKGKPQRHPRFGLSAAV